MRLDLCMGAVLSAFLCSSGTIVDAQTNAPRGSETIVKPAPPQGGTVRGADGARVPLAPDRGTASGGNPSGPPDRN